MTTTTSPPAARTNRFRGLLLVCAAGMVWGTIGPAAEVVHDRSGLSPLVISAYRATAAVIALAAACVAARRLDACRELVRLRWRRIVVTGVATASFQLLFFVAVVATGVSVATVVALGVAPVLLLVATSVQLGRAPAPAQVATIAAALVGLGLVSLGGGAGGSHAMLGVLVALGSGSAYAVATHVGAPLSREHDALAVTTATTVVVACVSIPGGLLDAALRGESMTTTDPGSWIVLAYLGVVTMAVAYVLLYAGLRSITSGSAVVATLLEPVTAVLIAVTLLHERPTAAVTIGTILILAAIASLGSRVDSDPVAQ